MKGNWLDRAIAEISPQWGLRRLSQRAALEEIQGLRTRRYDAAKVGRRTDGWTTSGSSANSEIGPQAARIRNRSRDLVRNNPYAAKAMRTLKANIVGQGIVPMIPGRDVAVKQSAMDDFNRFSETIDPEGLIDFYGLEGLVLGAVAESGECLVQKLPADSADNLAVPLQYRVLEPDYLDTAKHQPLDDGSVVIQGIEYDGRGRRTAYWLFDQHPGDNYPMIRRRYASTRVPADQILHVFDRLRPGQIRGVPWLAPVTISLHDFGDYSDAEQVRKKIAACFAAIVTKSGGGVPSLGVSETDRSGKRIEHFEPGMWQYLEPDEEVTFAVPPAAEKYEEYAVVQLHAIAAGAGVLYEQLTGDYSRVNFSSARAAKLEFWPCVDMWQQHMMVPQFCRRIWRDVDQLLVAMGARRQSIPMVEWVGPPRLWTDEEKQINATNRKVRAGLKDLRRAIVETTGRDPDVTLDEIAQTNEDVDRLGLVLDSDPRKTTRTGAAADHEEATGEEDGAGNAARSAYSNAASNGHAGHA